MELPHIFVFFYVTLSFHDRTPRLGPVPDPLSTVLHYVYITLFTHSHLHFKIVNVTIKLFPLHLNRSG